MNVLLRAALLAALPRLAGDWALRAVGEHGRSGGLGPGAGQREVAGCGFGAVDLHLVEARLDAVVGGGDGKPDEAGFDGPEGERSYFARAEFSDPDGNSWVLQEITTRLPGRTWED